MDQPESGGPDNPNLNSSPRNVSYVEPDNLDALFAEKWSKIPAAVREGVEQHVASRLPAELLKRRQICIRAASQSGKMMVLPLRRLYGSS